MLLTLWGFLTETFETSTPLDAPVILDSAVRSFMGSFTHSPPEAFICISSVAPNQNLRQRHLNFDRRRRCKWPSKAAVRFVLWMHLSQG